MNTSNNCFFTGRLTKNPMDSFKKLPSGSTVLNLSLAIRSTAKDKSGQSYERTDFANFIVWDELAEKLALDLEKGQAIEVQAQLQSRKYTGKDGSTKWVTEFVATHVVPKNQANAA